MRRPLSVRLQLVLIGAGLALAACANLGGPPPANTENIDAIQQGLLGDVPLPKGSRIDNDQSLMLGGGTGWAGRIVIQAPGGTTETFNYFRDQYPPLGWATVSAVKAKTSILVFAKADRTVTVEIADNPKTSANSNVVVTVAPRSTVAPPAPKK